MQTLTKTEKVVKERVLTQKTDFARVKVFKLRGGGGRDGEGKI